MKLSSCIKCNNKEHDIKSVWLPTKELDSWLVNMLPTSELFYIKICKKCGYTELYCAKLVNKEILKFFRNIFFDKHEYEIGELKYNKVKELAHFYSVENVHFSMFYNNYFRDMIYELKYKRKKYVAKAIYSIIQEQLDFIIKANQIDYIICVPTSKKREKERSFNQVELIYHNLPYKFLKIKKLEIQKKCQNFKKLIKKI